jgi:hypothetical protein
MKKELPEEEPPPLTQVNRLNARGQKPRVKEDVMQGLILDGHGVISQGEALRHIRESGVLVPLSTGDVAVFFRDEKDARAVAGSVEFFEHESLKQKPRPHSDAEGNTLHGVVLAERFVHPALADAAHRVRQAASPANAFAMARRELGWKEQSPPPPAPRPPAEKAKPAAAHAPPRTNGAAAHAPATGLSAPIEELSLPQAEARMAEQGHLMRLQGGGASLFFQEEASAHAVHKALSAAGMLDTLRSEGELRSYAVVGGQLHEIPLKRAEADKLAHALPPGHKVGGGAEIPLNSRILRLREHLNAPPARPPIKENIPRPAAIPPVPVFTRVLDAAARPAAPPEPRPLTEAEQLLAQHAVIVRVDNKWAVAEIEDRDIAERIYAKLAERGTQHIPRDYKTGGPFAPKRFFPGSFNTGNAMTEIKLDRRWADDFTAQPEFPRQRIANKGMEVPSFSRIQAAADTFHALRNGVDAAAEPFRPATGAGRA